MFSIVAAFKSAFIYMFKELKDTKVTVYTLLHLKSITNKNLLYSTWNSAQCYLPTWMGAGVWEEWIHVCVWLSPFTVNLKLPHC